MNRSRSLTPLAAAAAALALVGTAQAAPPKAKTSPAQASAAAVRHIPGRVRSTKYEFEDGRWQYAVLVSGRHGGLYEVEVDGTTGRVTDTEKTTPAEEAREAAGGG